MEGVAEVLVVQEYVNREENAIEVIYFFPIEESAALTMVEAEVEGRKVVGRVKEKEAAKEEYRDATSQGYTAVLVEEVRADVLEFKVGRLPVKASCRVSLTYLLEADVEWSKTRLTLPTNLTPRYSPSVILDAATVSRIGHTGPSPPVSLSLEVLARDTITALESPSHTLIISKEDTHKGRLHKRKASFKGTTVDMDQDFVILVASKDVHRPRLLIEKNEKSTTALLTFVPRVEDLMTAPSEIVFLIDCSGSMGGQNIRIAKHVLDLYLDFFPTDSTFNIVKFGSTMQLLFPSSQPCTDSTLKRARLLVRDLQANLGGAEILPALQAFLKQPPNQDCKRSKRPRQLFILTYGAVSNSQECIVLARAERENARVFTVGIGASAESAVQIGMLSRVLQGQAVALSFLPWRGSSWK